LKYQKEPSYDGFLRFALLRRTSVEMTEWDCLLRRTSVEMTEWDCLLRRTSVEMTEWDCLLRRTSVEMTGTNLPDKPTGFRKLWITACAGMTPMR
jgi:hypothetical protein